jgi:hypothetical protein
MSNFQNSNKFLKNKNAKYSLDEIETSENNTTFNDSLHKNKNISKTLNKNEQKQKQVNYYLALNTIQKKSNDTFQDLSLNELSKVDKINAKEKNISNYIKKPIIKEVIKIGNIIQKIKQTKVKKSIISLENNYKYNLIKSQNYPLMQNESEEDFSSTIINETKNTKSLNISNNNNKNIINITNNKYNNNINNINDNESNNKIFLKEFKEYINSSTKVTKNKVTDKKSSMIKNNNVNNNSNKRYRLDIINDLEESIDIKLNENNTKKGKINGNPSNALINQYFELDKNRFVNKSRTGIFNARIIKSFDFRNIRKNGINYSIHEIKHIKKWSNVDIILRNKNTKTTTGKKLRKKYERSELKSNYFANSSNQNNKRNYNSSIYIEEAIKKENENNYKHLTNEKVAKNLIGNFNNCQADDILENIHFDINESNNEDEDINDKVEFIDFLSNESEINKQNNNIISKECSNNDTFIIKTNDNINDLENENSTSGNIKNKYNKQRNNSCIYNINNNIYKNNININKSIDNFNSPSKIKEFTLLPKNINLKKNQKLEKIMLCNDNSIYKRNKSQNFLNIIPIDPEENGFLDLSDSPSYINTQTPLNIQNNSDKISLNNNLHNNYLNSQIKHSIYDLEFYQNLLIANNSYKKISYQKIFKNQPIVNWESRLNALLWMMKICEEFAFKRDTFHYSCFYFDLYLFLLKEKIKNKNELKLIGITCISISAKIEEVQIPKLIEYADSINDYYKIEDIINIEKKICVSLGWKLIPMTISSWLNWYTCQWDLFVYSIDGIKDKLLLFSDDDNILFFKRQNEISYYNYRRIYQIIDLIVLDYNFYKYEIRYLIAACFLICICLHYNLDYDFNKKIFKNKKYINKKNTNKNDICKVLLEIYIQFIEQSFDYSFKDKKLNECIYYVYKFINFKFSYDIPLIFQIEQDHINDYSYEDFISYQTTCANIFPFFKDIHKKEIKKIKNKKSFIINKKLPLNKDNKSQTSIKKQGTFKTRKSYSSRKSSLTKDNSKNKISNL